MRSFGFPAFYLPPFCRYSVSCTQCRPPLSVTRLDSLPPILYCIEAPWSPQSTAHTPSALPLPLSLSLYSLSLSLYSLSLSLYSLSLSLYSLSLPFYLLYLSSSSVLLLYVSHVVKFGCLRVVNQMSYLTIGSLENTSRLADVSLNWTINSTG